MRLYLAARYGRYPELQGYAKDLDALGHVVTSRWILGDHELRADGQAEYAPWHAVWAEEDWTDLRTAEVCVSFTEGHGSVPGRARGGRHVEFGMALVLGHTCIVVGPREHVFHWLPEVIVCPTWADALRILEGLELGVCARDDDHRNGH